MKVRSENRNRYKRYEVPSNYKLYVKRSKEKNIDFFTQYEKYDLTRTSHFFNKNGLYIDRLLNICWVEFEDLAFITPNYYENEYIFLSDPLNNISKDDIQKFINLIQLIPDKKIQTYLNEFLHHETMKRIRWEKPTKDSPRFRMRKFMKERGLKMTKKPIPLP